VFANNDDMALGAIDAFHEKGAELPLVVGVDATAPALEAVKSGELYGTVLNDAQGIAQAMLDLALALTKGEDPADTVDLEDDHYIWLPYRLVTRENLGEFLEGYRL
ncbi:MAG: substrate-binding domain-containing protein, partial [Lawsonibacter sp.]